MIDIGGFSLDVDGPWTNLILNLGPGIRLHASCKSGECPAPQVLITIHLRHHQPWLVDTVVRDRETLLRLSHKSYHFTDLSELFKPNDGDADFLSASKQTIMEMEIPAVKIDFLTDEIRKYVTLAGKFARAKKTELMTIALEFGSPMAEFSGEVENGGRDDCAICLNGLSEKVVRLSCMHKFHFSCLLKWFKEKIECPGWQGESFNYIE